MNSSPTALPLTRREFLRGAGGIGFMAFSGFAPAFLARSALAHNPAPERDRSIFVILQLAGGNDGLNTVIPYTDDNYYRLRPTLGLRKQLLHLTDELALHPSMAPLHALYDTGQLAIIQNVGYPNPNRSHFRSTEIWETASDSDRVAHTGWLGRYLDNTCSGSPGPDHDPDLIHVGDILPQSALSKNPQFIFGIRPQGRVGSGQSAADAAYATLLGAEHSDGGPSYLQQTMMNTRITERRVQQQIGRYKPAAQFPNTTIGHSLRRISALIHADTETRVYFATLGGFDTHANQLQTHAGFSPSSPRPWQRSNKTSPPAARMNRF